jgi:hypothetical protein
MEAINRLIEKENGHLKAVGNALCETGDAAHKVMNEVGAVGKNLVNESTSEGKKGLEYIEKIAQENPITTIVVSAAAGLLIAKLIRH